jgi:hypothetical protein
MNRGQKSLSKPKRKTSIKRVPALTAISVTLVPFRVNNIKAGGVGFHESELVMNIPYRVEAESQKTEKPAGGPAFRVLCEGWGFWPTRRTVGIIERGPKLRM